MVGILIFDVIVHCMSIDAYHDSLIDSIANGGKETLKSLSASFSYTYNFILDTFVVHAFKMLVRISSTQASFNYFG